MQIGKAAVLVLIIIISSCSLNNILAQDKQEKVTVESKCEKSCEVKVKTVAKSEVITTNTCAEAKTASACAEVKTAEAGTEVNTAEACIKGHSKSDDTAAGCCAKKAECTKRAECEKKCEQKQ